MSITLVVAVLALPVPVARAQPDALERFRSALIDYFRRYAYIPVIVDRGYNIGDVIESDGVGIRARAARCFPTLSSPSTVRTSLPDVVETEAAGTSFGLKLRQLVGLGGQASLQQQIQIRFSNVSSVSVPSLDFRDALDRVACPELAPLIDNTWSPLQADNQIFFVIGEILYGKREAILQLASTADLGAQTARIAQVVGEDANLKFSVSTGGVVVLRNDRVVPLALRPLSAPRIVRKALTTRGEAIPARIVWRPVACINGPQCERAFAPVTHILNENEPNLDPEELNR